MVAEKEKSERLEKKRQEKAFNKVMLNSPIGLFIQKFPFLNLKLEKLLNASSGPLIQDPPAAEEGHSSIILDPVALWNVEVLNPGFFLAVQTSPAGCYAPCRMCLRSQKFKRTERERSDSSQ